MQGRPWGPRSCVSEYYHEYVRKLLVTESVRGDLFSYMPIKTVCILFISLAEIAVNVYLSISQVHLALSCT